MRNKRGQGLPLTTIIIAIMVIVVLIVIVAFFFSSSSTLTQSIRRVFFGTTAGADQALSIENCKVYCQQAEGYPISQQTASPYCMKYFQIDTDNDGEAQFNNLDGKRIYDHFYCNPTPTDIEKLDQTKATIRSLNIGCTFTCPDLPKG